MKPLFLLPSLNGADIPLVPGADEARRWAQEELAKKEYQDAKPGFAQLILEWFRKALGDLLNGTSSPGAGLALTIFLAVMVAVVVLIIFVIRPRLLRRNAPVSAVFDGPTTLSAAEHRNLAFTASEQRDFESAVSETFRAIVRSSEERGVCLPTPGRTAFEVVAELTPAFPALTADLDQAADHFSAVRYGHARATATMYASLMQTDHALLSTTPNYQETEQRSSLSGTPL